MPLTTRNRYAGNLCSRSPEFRVAQSERCGANEMCKPLIWPLCLFFFLLPFSCSSAGNGRCREANEAVQKPDLLSGCHLVAEGGLLDFRFERCATRSVQRLFRMAFWLFSSNANTVGIG